MTVWHYALSPLSLSLDFDILMNFDSSITFHWIIKVPSSLTNKKL